MFALFWQVSLLPLKVLPEACQRPVCLRGYENLESVTIMGSPCQ